MKLEKHKYGAFLKHIQYILITKVCAANIGLTSIFLINIFGFDNASGQLILISSPGVKRFA